LLQQDHELVTGQAAEGVLAAQAVPQAPGHPLKQQVAGAVSVAVVDELEAVQVQIEQHQTGLMAPGRGQVMREALLSRRPVEQARQGIVVGQVLDLDLGLLLRRDVLEGAEGRAGLTHGVEGELGPGMDPFDLAVDDDAVGYVVGRALEGGLPSALEAG